MSLYYFQTDSSCSNMCQYASFSSFSLPSVSSAQATCLTPTDYLMRLHALRFDQQDYLKALGEATENVFPLYRPDDEGRVAGAELKTVVAEFPPGVFDMKKKKRGIPDER